MIQEASWCSDQQVHSFLKFFRLVFSVSATHDDAVRVIVVFYQVRHNAKRLQGKLSGRRNDYHACACKIK